MKKKKDLTLKEVVWNEDGTMDLIDSNGAIYKNCKMTKYTEPEYDEMTVQKCDVIIENKVDKCAPFSFDGKAIFLNGEEIGTLKKIEKVIKK